MKPVSEEGEGEGARRQKGRSFLAMDFLGRRSRKQEECHVVLVGEDFRPKLAEVMRGARRDTFGA